MAFPKEHWQQLHSTNPLERLNGEIKRRTNVVAIFPNEAAIVRLLGIPTVVDRLIQQALHQVLMPLFDPGFSAHSYGFRAGRSAHDAVVAARVHVARGRRIVVDLDLENPGLNPYGIHTSDGAAASLKPSMRSIKRSRPRAMVLGPGGL